MLVPDARRPFGATNHLYYKASFCWTEVRDCYFEYKNLRVCRGSDKSRTAWRNEYFYIV